MLAEMHRMSLVLCCVIAFCPSVSEAQAAIGEKSDSTRGANAPIEIDFEVFPGVDGVFGTEDDEFPPFCDFWCYELVDEFSSIGVRFNTGSLYQVPGGFFPDRPADNHFVSRYPLNIELDQPAFSVSIRSYSVWNAVLYVYDQRDQLIASDTLSHPDPQSDFYLGTMSVTTEEPIYQVIVMADTCAPDPVTPMSCDEILNLDDLRLGMAISAIFTDGFESGDLTAWESP